MAMCVAVDIGVRAGLCLGAGLHLEVCWVLLSLGAYVDVARVH